MNKARRQDLSEVADILDQALDSLCAVKDEEQDAFDNMPEGLQYGPRGESMLEAIDIMEGWESEILEIKSKIEDFVG